MRRLSTEQISDYVRRERPLDCAGAFKSEGLGIALIRRVESLDSDRPGRPAIDIADRYVLRAAG